MGNQGQTNSYLQKRTDVSQEKVLEAALSLFAKHGYSETSIDEIQRLSGVAKTTIYRHWKSKSEIAISILTRLNDIVPYPEQTGHLRQDLENDLGSLAKLLALPKWSRLVLMLIEAGESDAQLQELRLRFVSEKHQRLEAILRKAISDGVLFSNMDIDYAISRFYSIPFYKRLVLGKKTTTDEVKHIVEGFMGEFGSSREVD